MNSLYNNYHATNEAGNRLTKEVENALEPIITKWFNAGYSPAEIESIIASVVTVSLGEKKLTHATRMNRNQ